MDSSDPNREQETKHSLESLKVGDYFAGPVKITRKFQAAKTILTVTDGMYSMDATISRTTFNVGDIVEIQGAVTEYSGRLQIEARDMKASTHDFDAHIEKLSHPVRTELSVRSASYEKLRPYFIRIAHKIRKAILNHQAIIIRHHADADGIMAGMSIEKSCEMLMQEIGLESEHYLYRSPSRAPFYEFADFLRDVSLSERVLAPFGRKPLVLVLDNGSTPEDIFALRTAKSLGYDVIVIDHHNPVVMHGKKTSVCPYLLDHVNPYMEGLDGTIAAGLECYEIARMIHENFENLIYPAVSVIGDRVNTPEGDEYLKRSGKSREELMHLVIAIDFLAYHLKFDSGRKTYEKIFSVPEFTSLINEKVKESTELQLQSTLPYLRTFTIGNITLSYIDLEKYTLRFQFPTPGKLIGNIHDIIKDGREDQPIITLGLLSDMIIIRATKPVLPVAKIIETLKAQIPEANVDGGGHEVAGTIRFVGAHQEAILENIKVQVRNLARETETKE